MSANNRKYMVFGAVLVVCSLGLGIEFLLQATGSGSLCETEACEATSSYLGLAEFGEVELIFLGFAFFVVLSGLLGLAWLSRGKSVSRYALGLLWMLLAGALAFDGALIGYQLSVPGPPCLLCAIVAGAVLVVLAAASWHGGIKSAFVAGLAVWCGGFLASSLLDHTMSVADAPKLKNAAIVEELNYDGSNAAGVEEYYLFFSYNCPHCSEIIDKLAQSRPEGKWRFVCVDRDPESLKRAACAAGQQGDAFSRIEESKSCEFEHENEIPEDTLDEIEKTTQEALGCFESMDVAGVPALIVEKPDGERVTLPGAEKIMSFLGRQEQKSAPDPAPGSGSWQQKEKGPASDSGGACPTS